MLKNQSHQKTEELLDYPEIDSGLNFCSPNEAALVAALASGKLAGAALDVFEVEPLPGESGLRKFEQCIFGTHNGSHTKDAVLRVNELAINNLLAGLGVEGYCKNGS